MADIMTFVLQGRDNLTRVLNQAGDSADRLGKRLLKLGAVGGAAPTGAAVTAGVGAMAAAFASAGVAAGAFQLAVKPQIKLMQDNAKAAEKVAAAQETAANKQQVADKLRRQGSELAEKAQKAATSAKLAAIQAENQYARQTKGLPKATADSALALAKLKTAHQSWSDELAKDTMPIFTRGIDAARKSLPMLTPLVKTTAAALTDFADSGDKSGGLKRFVGRLNEAAKTTLPALLRTGRNVFRGLGGIIDAFLPSSGKLTEGLERGSAAFARWGQSLKHSEGFQRFMESASAGGGALKNVALAAGELLSALSPLLGTTAQLATGFANVIKWLPPETLSFIAGAILGIKVATYGWAAAQAVLNLALNANPIGLVILAIVAVGAAMVTLWKKSRTFRETLTTSFTIISSGALMFAEITLKVLREINSAFLSWALHTIGVADAAFGWVPGLGGKLDKARAAVELFGKGTEEQFDGAIDKVGEWRDAVERLPVEMHLKGNIEDLTKKINDAKRQLSNKNLPAEKRAKLTADITKWNKGLVDARVRLERTPSKKEARLTGDIRDWVSKINDAKRQLKNAPASKKAKLMADIADLVSKVRAAKTQLAGLKNRTVTVTTHYQVTGSSARRTGSHGSQIKNAKGGLIRGPGTGTSDSIPMWASDGEFTIRAASVRKYGVAMFNALNEGRLGAGQVMSQAASSARVSIGGMATAGADTARGLAGGITGSLGLVGAAARNMAAAIVTGVRTELQIASPSKKMQALAKDVGKGLILGLTGSKAKIAATAKDLVKDIWKAWAGTKSTKDSTLVKMVNRETKKLQELASKRDSLAKKIADAKKFAGDVTANARQGAELGSLGLAPEEVSAGSIKGALAQKLAQIKQFTRHIDLLAKKGLSKGLLRQILNMGPEAGSAYASALAGADKGTLASINSMQSQIDKSSTRLGLVGADALYDSGKDAGKGFLKGLTSQQSAIEKKMLEIAKGMDKAIRKALGIKSPSTVMADVGRYSTEGLALGLTDRMPVLDHALSAVTERVASARPVLGRPAVARSGGPVVINIHVHGTVVDRLGAARALQEAFLELKRTKGGAQLGIA